MFGRTRYGRRGHYGGGMGLILMAMQLVSFFNFLSRSDRFFPVTLGVLALNIVVYLRPDVGLLWPSIEQACISARKVWLQRNWKPLFFSPFVHGHEYHLFYNMGSFMWKAVSLERHFGSGYFLYMTAVFSILTGIVYVAIETLLSQLLDDWTHMNSCAVGFSGVIFALKVVATHIQPQGMVMVMGLFPVSSRLACWAELVLISALFPNVSFVGHLSGILVGVAFVSGPLKYTMDAPLSLVNFNNLYNSNRGREAGRSPRSSGRRGEERRTTPYPSYTYAARNTGYRNSGRDEEEEEIREVIRLSLQEQQQRQEENDSNTDHEPQATIERSTTQTVVDSPPTAHPPPSNPDYVPATSAEDLQHLGDIQIPPMPPTSHFPPSESEDGKQPSEKSFMPPDSGPRARKAWKERDSRQTLQHAHEDEWVESSDHNRAAMRAARIRRLEKKT